MYVSLLYLGKISSNKVFRHPESYQMQHQRFMQSLCFYFSMQKAKFCYRTSRYVHNLSSRHTSSGSWEQ